MAMRFYLLIVVVACMTGCRSVNTLGPARIEAEARIDWVDPGVKGQWFIGLKED